MNKLFKLGLFQAVGVTVYISMVATIMNNAEHVFGKMDSFLSPIAFLTMFSVSALSCGLIVFYQPYKLFFDGKKNEALTVVVYTAISLLFILFTLFLVMYYIR